VRSFLIVALIAIGCSTTGAREDHPVSNRDNSTTPTPRPSGAKVYLSTPRGEVGVEVEVVKTPRAIERGLMFRQNLPPDDGMLFLLGVEKDWPFWMRNTLIPLDMIYIAKDMKVVGVVANAEPETDTIRSVGETSLYVLEVNGGWCASRGVSVGSKVRFEKVEP